MQNNEQLLKPIWQMTGEEFIELLKMGLHKSPKQSIDNQTSTSNPTATGALENKYVYGIRGIANLLDCSISTANRIKKTGVLDDAIIQRGRTIMVDVEKALELLKEDSEI